MHVGLKTRVVTEEEARSVSSILAIDSTIFPEVYPPTLNGSLSIQIPSDLILQFINSSDNPHSGSMRLGSYVYNDIAGLFPTSIEGHTDIE